MLAIVCVTPEPPLREQARSYPPPLFSNVNAQMKYLPEPGFTHDSILKTGILLVNLGTPDEPTASAVRPYLKQFLSDRRVVEIPRLAWWLILNGVILNTRPKKSAAKYAKIWTSEGSPLLAHTRRLAQLLRGCLGEKTKSPLVLAVGMRYGNPSIASAIAELKAKHCDRILLLPLYPQYAASTTASAMDAVFAAFTRYRNMPSLRVVRHYHDHLAYINALASNVLAYWAKHGKPNKLVMSFHGVPRFTLDKGDPYHCECQKTGRLLAEALGLMKEQYIVSFQSLFGRAEWIKPYTEPTLLDLAKRGVARVDIVCPGFPVDCLETLEEIAIEGKATFLGAGGKEYHYIPCLNENDTWIKALANIAMENLQGWLSENWSQADSQVECNAALARAKALGASK
jgi:protoporphyrin/coproporphyrin ferrochelatase